MSQTPHGAGTPAQAGGDDRPVAIGTGPGDPAHLTAKAQQLLDDADVVVGFETVVDRVREHTDADVRPCSYDDQSAVLTEFASRVNSGEAGVAVLWGDPNVSGGQFLERIEDAVGGPVRVVPGVSSVQVAAARARTPLEHSTVISLHRRGDLEAELERMAEDAGRRHLHVLVRPYDWMPPAIATWLVDRGADPSLEAIAFEDLTLPAEAVTHTTLGELAHEMEMDETDTDETDTDEMETDDEVYSDRTILTLRAT